MNVEKTMAARFSGHLSPVKIILDQKQVENAEYSNTGLTNDARFLREIKSRTAMSKQRQQIGLKLKDETSKMIRYLARY